MVDADEFCAFTARGICIRDMTCRTRKTGIHKLI